MEFVIKASPIFLIAVLGYFLKKQGLFLQSHADLFLRMVFFMALPGLIFKSFHNIHINSDLAILPLVAALVLFGTYLIAYLVSRFLNLTREKEGVFVIGSLIMNTAFVLTFVIVHIGEEGVARLLLFDIGNAGLALTFGYYLACKYGSNDYSTKNILKKLVSAPPIYALFIALSLKILNWRLPDVLLDLSGLLGALAIPLIMLALGIYFTPRIIFPRIIILSLAIRMCGGFILGYSLAWLLNAQGLERLIILAGTSAPIGFNTLVFSSLENLDKELAASLVSVAILLGFVTIPLLFYLFQ